MTNDLLKETIKQLIKECEQEEDKYGELALSNNRKCEEHKKQADLHNSSFQAQLKKGKDQLQKIREILKKDKNASREFALYRKKCKGCQKQAHTLIEYAERNQKSQLSDEGRVQISIQQFEKYEEKGLMNQRQAEKYQQKCIQIAKLRISLQNEYLQVKKSAEEFLQLENEFRAAFIIESISSEKYFSSKRSISEALTKWKQNKQILNDKLAELESHERSKTPLTDHWWAVFLELKGLTDVNRPSTETSLTPCPPREQQFRPPLSIVMSEGVQAKDVGPELYHDTAEVPQVQGSFSDSTRAETFPTQEGPSEREVQVLAPITETDGQGELEAEKGDKKRPSSHDPWIELRNRYHPDYKGRDGLNGSCVAPMASPSPEEKKVLPGDIRYKTIESNEDQSDLLSRTVQTDLELQKFKKGNKKNCRPKMPSTQSDKPVMYLKGPFPKVSFTSVTLLSLSAMDSFRELIKSHQSSRQMSGAWLVRALNQVFESISSGKDSMLQDSVNLIKVKLGTSCFTKRTECSKINLTLRPSYSLYSDNLARKTRIWIAKLMKCSVSKLMSS